MAVNVRVEQTFYAIKVYIDNALHLYLQRNQLIGFQAWRDDNQCCTIEFTMRDGVVTAEYDDFEKFLEVLKQLDATLK